VYRSIKFIKVRLAEICCGGRVSEISEISMLIDFDGKRFEKIYFQCILNVSN
jgi:hypothetical protein